MRTMKVTVIVFLFGIMLGMPAFAKQKKAASKSKDKVEEELTRLTQLYSKGAIKGAYLWDQLEENFRKKNLTNTQIMEVKKLQALALYKAGYPITGSMYASDVIENAGKPYTQPYESLWKLLWMTSRERPIQYLLEELALKKSTTQMPSSFGDDWEYVIANAYILENSIDKAVKHYGNVKISNRYYMPAQYQLAMIYGEQKNMKDAEVALKAILHSTTRDLSPLDSDEKEKMWNYANMALARHYYQEREFLKSVRHFRNVTRNSSLFYESLFEQSWALFMSGNPMHSLGSLYGVHSPYFTNRYNPESKILESIVYYWMCRYDNSRNSLADFAEKYGQSVEGINNYLEREKLTATSAYLLFEDLVSGVSAESLGIPRTVLETAAEKDSMVLLRDQLASVMAERERLDKVGVFGKKAGLDGLDERLEKTEQKLKTALGQQFITELRSVKTHFEDLYSQAQFLYIELLMSEKEQLLGRELHVSSKMQKATSENIKGWSRDTQSWTDDKYEFWWDEIGFQVVSVEPMCK
ncbi:MAG: tetratricopeptide repeat protein [Oligoflexales bacterium]